MYKTKHEFICVDCKKTATRTAKNRWSAGIMLLNKGWQVQNLFWYCPKCWRKKNARGKDSKH